MWWVLVLPVQNANDLRRFIYIYIFGIIQSHFVPSLIQSQSSTVCYSHKCTIILIPARRPPRHWLGWALTNVNSVNVYRNIWKMFSLLRDSDIMCSNFPPTHSRRLWPSALVSVTQHTALSLDRIDSTLSRLSFIQLRSWAESEKKKKSQKHRKLCEIYMLVQKWKWRKKKIHSATLLRETHKESTRSCWVYI